VGVPVLPLVSEVPGVPDVVVLAAVLTVPFVAPVPSGSGRLAPLVPMPGIVLSVVAPPSPFSPSHEMSETHNEITAASASRMSAICLMLFFIFVLLCFIFPNFSA
jgi:hypothetical protein